MHAVGRRDEVVRRDVGELGQRRRAAELSADLGRDLLGEAGCEVGVRDALENRAAERAGRRRHEEQRGDRIGPGGLAEDGDVGRVAAEAADVVLHPAQGGELIEEPAVVGCAGHAREALEPGPVVRADDHGAGRGQGGAGEVRDRRSRT